MIAMEDKKEFEETKTNIVGHILIRDVDTGQVLVNQRDQILGKPLGLENDVESDTSD